MNIKRIAILLLVVILSTFMLFACNDTESYEVDPDHLYFNEDTFKIVQFADFHEWMGIEKAVIDVQSELKPLLVEYIESVLDLEKPDLVVLTGDNIFSLNLFYDLIKDSVSINTYKAFGELFEKHEQPWTMTFGNHDSESAKTKIDFLNAVKSFEHFIGGTDSESPYYKQLIGEDDRVGNFSIPILDTNGNVKFNVFLLDSGSFNSVPTAGTPYKYITDEQCDWYKSEVNRLKELNDGNIVPSILFTHIPLFEHAEAYFGEGERIGVWTGISPSETRSRIFEDAIKMGDVKGIFTGHNHANSISVIYQRDDRKIMMGVTPQAAAASYDDTTSTMYSRVINISMDGSFFTYIHTSKINTTVPDNMPHAYVFRNEILGL